MALKKHAYTLIANNRGLAPVSLEEFIRGLEPVTCRVVQEELNAIVEQRQPEVFQLDPDSPLYDDLKELNKPGELEFVSHEEVWGELPQIQ